MSVETPKAPYALPAKIKAAKVPKVQKPGKPSKYNKNKVQPDSTSTMQQRFTSPVFSTQPRQQFTNQSFGQPTQQYGHPRPQQQRCDQSRCPHYLTVKSHGVNGDYSNVDWDHLRDEHLRTWAEFGWHKMKQYERELNNQTSIVTESKQAISNVTDTTNTTNNDLFVDPVNHVEGICDALIANGIFILKCTDAVRHGKKTCVAHLNHTQLIKLQSLPCTSNAIFNAPLPYTIMGPTVSDFDISDEEVDELKKEDFSCVEHIDQTV